MVSDQYQTLDLKVISEYLRKYITLPFDRLTHKSARVPHKFLEFSWLYIIATTNKFHPRNNPSTPGEWTAGDTVS